MFKRFRKNQTTVESPHFLKRRKLFWQWFTDHAATFQQAIENRNFDQHTATVSNKIDELFPEFAWVFGPGETDGEHSFTLSPEGNPYKAVLINQILKSQPEIPGWVFYGSRQPSESFAEGSMNVAGASVQAEEIWVTPTIDEEEERINIVCWNPNFQPLPEKDRSIITFLWLDEALGELAVENRLGTIDINDSSLANAMPLSELPEFVAATEEKLKWKQQLAGEYYASYRFPERGEFSPTHHRSDIIGGTSLLWELSRDFDKAEGHLDHPSPETGVDYLFIELPMSELTLGKQVDERGAFEDLIEETLGHSFILLGGVLGRENCYIDLINFAGAPALEELQSTLSNHAIFRKATWRFFDRQRISAVRN